LLKAPSKKKKKKKNPKEHLRTFNINQDVSRVFREELLQGSND